MISENLTLNRIVIHEVFKRRTEDRNPVEPVYGTALSILDAEALDTLRSRVIAAMGRTSQSIEMDIRQSGAGSMLTTARELLSATSDEEFVTLSREAAKQLTSAQKSVNIPGGVLVVFDGQVDYPAKRVIGVIKAEPQNGFTRARVAENMVLQFLRDLILTPQSKLYKIGIFIEANPQLAAGANPVEGFRAFVFDNLMSAKNRDAAAVYFYEGFLGCGFPQSSARLTREFHKLTTEFIKKLDIPQVQKMDLQTSLYAYLKVDNSQTIGTRQFGETYLADGPMRDAYRDFMNANAFPEHAINKDLTDVASELKMRKARFGSEIRLIAPADKFRDLVKIEEITESSEGEPVQWTRVTIRDRFLGQE